MTKAKLERMVRLISEVYFHHAAGGALHVVIDDENVDAGSLEMCSENAGEAYKKARAEVHCCNALRLLSEKERMEAINHYKHSRGLR